LFRVVTAVLDRTGEACTLESFLGETRTRRQTASFKVLFSVDLCLLDASET